MMAISKPQMFKAAIVNLMGNYDEFAVFLNLELRNHDLNFRNFAFYILSIYYSNIQPNMEGAQIPDNGN